MSTPSVSDLASQSENTLYLVDVSSFIFRAYYAIRHLSTPSGEPVNAVFGVASMLYKMLADASPRHVVVAYDSKEPSFRKEMYTEYKANRSAPPDDLIPQFARIEQLVESMGFHSFRQPGVEADDLIATLARKWVACGKDHRVVIVTGDKDLMQLVGDRVRIWDTMKNVVYGPEQVEEKFGVGPDLIRDYLALVGDSSDNIPGVPSIGPKSAVQLLKEHESLDGVIQAALAGKVKGKKGEVIAENREKALLSAKLVSLKEDCEIDFKEADCSYEFQVRDSLASLLRELNFNTLLERWKAALPGDSGGAAGRTGGASGAAASGGSVATSPAAAEVSAGPQAEFETVNTEARFREVLLEIESKGEFAVDLETTSLNPREAEIVGIALATEASRGLYIPIGHRGTNVEQLPAAMVLEKLKPLLENPKIKKIGQNLKYDWSVFYQAGIVPDGIGADTMVAAYVVEPEGRHGFDLLCQKYLGYDTMKYEDVCGKGKDQIGFDLVPVDQATRYAAEDAVYTLRLWEVLKGRLEADGLMRVFAEIELPLVPILAKMECQGVCLDTDWLGKLSRDFEKEIAAIDERIQAYAKGPVNLNSPKQLAQLLFDELGLPPQSKTKTGYSTDATVLEALAPLHEVPRLLVEYREISKLKGTYVDPLPKMIDSKTGKIHASFHQTVAATGRLSSSDPNLQNIPVKTERGQLIRRAFVPSQGNLLVSADYSQIELRILAHMSGDKDLMRSFVTGEDVHRRTASELFNVKPEEVDDRQRGIAKAINFGLMYGKTAFGLSQELKIPRGEAKDIIDRYFQRYSAVKRFLDGQIAEAKEKGYVQTLSGRKRRLPGINASNAVARGVAERMAMNSPIQGTAADLVKIAMIRLDEALAKSGLRSKVIVQVHDELVLDCPKEEVAAARALVEKTMEGAMELSVPLKVNSAAGENWMEL